MFYSIKFLYDIDAFTILSVVFMGSEKYPDENAFDSFIKKHGGNDNAFTDCERVSRYSLS